MRWFEVDKDGLAKLLERRGKEFVLYELIQNAWDQNVTRVNVTLTKGNRARVAELCVEDDDPDGFRDLAHSFTLFAESDKKADARRRGRFNLGEKLVLALCEEAEIVSTKGGFRFDKNGRRRLRRRRASGTQFAGRLRLTNEEVARCEEAAGRLLPPPGIETFFNGRLLCARQSIASFEAALKTEISGPDGYLKPTTRKTSVLIIRPADGETGTLYEMGIPVVETGDGFHLDVQQKIPLNLDRDNVAPSYLRTLRTHTLNAMHESIDLEQVNAPWVRDGLTDERISNEAVRSVVARRFGEKAVVYDPSDPEANKLAHTHGYVVISGNQLSKPEWSNVRRAGALLPAGQVTPSPKPFHPNGTPLKTVPSSEWTTTQAKKVERIRILARALLGCDIEVKIADDRGWCFDAAYGNRSLVLNEARLGDRFFDDPDFSEKDIDLLIHEFGHHYSPDHLSEDYFRALSELGGRLSLAAARNPSLLL